MSVVPLPVVAVASGKGGVGKTTVAVALARRLVADGRKVGLVDADIYGPDVPRMLGIRRDVDATSLTLSGWGGRGSGLEAVDVDGLKVASVGFLLGGRQGLTIGGPFGDMLLARLVTQTRWGDAELLVVDLPPGTGDVQQALLGQGSLVAAVLVVTPAEVAHLDTGRAVTVLRAAKAQILGGVENMSYLECPGCGERTTLHRPAPADRTIWAQGVPKLTALPYRIDGSIVDSDLAPVAAAVTHWQDTA
jgi:ATP-binding protein involved in chromosome partitioning